MTIADRIQTLRKTKGISQEELADKIGVSRQAVSKWESEQSTPDVEKIILLSNYFETTTDYLLKGIEPAAKQENKWNGLIFSTVGTAVNIIGLFAAIAIWLERQMTYAVGIGFIFMAVGTMIFVIGQVTDSSNKKKSRKLFALVNVWILLFIPLSCCFNILDGLFGGFTGQLAPMPLLGNSFVTLGLCWLVYIVVCVVTDIVIVKAAGKNEN
ncbi:helix-turn-helix transcriptional regulator [Anaerolentibacter hominis]|uniref:helix-turn-helix domain-containing protein n=1 Tax=Anaerolentibacter hominis TaxID=3079009 RepID=UPI0031B89666